MAKFKFRYLLILLLCLIVYLLIGATAPFSQYQSVSKETKEQFSMDQYYQENPSCDRAMLLESNESALLERIRLLSAAKKRVILSTFDMRDGKSTRDILSLLLHKAEEGVSVKIIVDGISGCIRMENHPLFQALSGQPNVEIKIYNPLNIALPWKTQGRMHDKYIIVDDLAYILGGRNTFDYFIGTYTTKNQSYDREVLIFNENAGTEHSRESSLFQIEEYFNDVWNLEVCEYFHDDEKVLEKQKVKEEVTALHDRYQGLIKKYPELFVPYPYERCTYETGRIRLISNPVTIYGKEPVVFYELTELMKRAENKVTIHTPYIVLNSYMREELKEVTEKVEAEVVINSVENGDNFVASSDYLRQKKKVLNTGISLYEYDGGISYHGKSVVIDDKLAIIGSYNMDLRSSYMDTELMLSVQSEGLAKELLNHMAEIRKDCRRVLDEDTYEIPDHINVAQVPFWKRAAWWFVGLILQPFRYLI